LLAEIMAQPGSLRGPGRDPRGSGSRPGHL